jgi:alpha-ribazole phosphatase
MTKIILLRHGESLLNKENVYFGFTDSPLTKNGKEEILKKIKNIPSYDLIYSSSLSRALESAQIINFKNLHIKTDERLKELNFGIFENKSYKEIKESHKDECDKWTSENISYTFPEGESIHNLSERVISFIEEIKNLNKSILIVTHYGVINSILCHYISNNIESFWKFKCSHGSITTIEFHHDFPVLTSFSV